MSCFCKDDTMLIQVALPVPLYRLFDYRVIGVLPKVGVRVKVPFSHQELIGIVVGHVHPNDSDVPQNKLKSLIDVIDDEPIFDEYFFKLARWLSSYYHHPFGDTMAVMLPTLIKAGVDVSDDIRRYRVPAHVDDDFVKNVLSKTAKKQHANFAIIRDNPNATKYTLHMLGVTEKNLALFAQKGLIECHTTPNTPPPQVQMAQEPLTLNDEQRSALMQISQSIHDGCYRGILLNGITGSGKTEVYLHAMEQVLAQGRQVLIMVPEIGLTPQNRTRFLARFRANVVVLHSALNDKERLLGWQACRQGQAQIIIATRSALFYPFANLGLIIVDEAHDTSFKQQDHLRYHACDVALYVGVLKQIPVVLGTATPSLEQIKLSHDNKLYECKLTKRAGNATPPTFDLVDMRVGTLWQTDMAGESRDTKLSHQTVQAVRDTLERGEQVLMFLNRRGYAPILLCGACGWQADCVRCSSHLTLHKNPFKKARHANEQYLYDYLKCHHCGYQVVTPKICPGCHSPNLVHLGQGTGQLYERLHGIFANPQTVQNPYPIVQIDRDTVRGKGAWDKLYERVSTGEPMILVGTQMLAKGHHFPNVTLVVIVNADSGFLSPDFRSPERTAQMIMQVAGRAGRAGRAGKVLIQTLNPDNPLLLDLIRQGYDKFAHDLLAERCELGLPPYSHAVLIRADGNRLDAAKNAIIGAKNHLPNAHPFAVLAPIDAPMVKKNNRFHVQMLILAKERKVLHDVLAWWWQDVLALPSSRGVKMTIDIDPMGW